MKPVIECTSCKGEAVLNPELKKRTYRGDEFLIYQHNYKCKKCNKIFNTKETDEYNERLLHNKYREKYNIPSPEQLIFVREIYGLSQTRMSEILGFGPNQYRLYEAGDIPTGGNATVLSLIINPEEFKTILEKKKTDADTKKLYKNILNIIERSGNIDFKTQLKNSLFPVTAIPDSYTGYRLPSFEKLGNMALFFLPNAAFKTRLNKLLSYADFAHFKYFGASISGCKYAAIDMGTVPDQYAIIYDLMEYREFLKTDIVQINKNEVEKFVMQKEIDEKLFTNSELRIMEMVLDTFKNKTTAEITNICHLEQGWIANEKTKSRIDYSIYALQLKAV